MLNRTPIHSLEMNQIFFLRRTKTMAYNYLPLNTVLLSFDCSCPAVEVQEAAR